MCGNTFRKRCIARADSDAERSALRLRDVPRLYEAMRTWNKLITSQDSENWVQLSLGTVIGAFSTSFSVIDVEILKMFFAEL